LTEYFRRVIFAALDSSSFKNLPPPENLEISIIIAAAAVGAVFGSFVISPFESVRIRTVSDEGFGGNENFFKGLAEIVEAEGVISLFEAVPVFMLKEIPFAIAKFGVFDYASSFLYNAYPVAREDLKLSLSVSLLSGCLSGIAAAFVSNPADCVVSEMKGAKKKKKKKTEASEKLGPVETAKLMYETKGVDAFLRALPLRMAFYSLTVSIQFLLYDSFRVLLKIGRDDLNLFLDVLGGVLSEKAGDIM